MSLKVRSKFVCNSIQDNPENENKTVMFLPVTTGSVENESFSKYTPSGSIIMNVSYETSAVEFFEEGKEYFVDFTEAK